MTFWYFIFWNRLVDQVELREQLFVCRGVCKGGVIVGFDVCWLSYACWSRMGPYFSMPCH